MGDTQSLKLSPQNELALLDEHALSMQLYRAVGFVMAVKEAMWEELEELMVDRRCKDGQQGESEIDGVSSGEGRSSGSGSGSNGTMYGFCPITGKRLGAPDKGAKCGKEILAEYGWDSEEENRDVWRARFEALVDRYKRCVS